MIKLKSCPCGCVDVELKKEPLWHGSHGYSGCYRFIVKCKNPLCKWSFSFYDNDTIYHTNEEAKRNTIEQWNKRG